MQMVDNQFFMIKYHYYWLAINLIGRKVKFKFKNEEELKSLFCIIIL